jgi:hypothetical protein
MAAPSLRRRRALVAWLLVGPLAWAVQFSLLYGFAATACARGFADRTLLGIGVVAVATLLVSAAALAATGLALWRSLAARGPDAPETDRYLADSGVAMSAISLVAILWHALPAALVQPCW